MAQINGELSRKHANYRSRSVPAPRPGLLNRSYPLRSHTGVQRFFPPLPRGRSFPIWSQRPGLSRDTPARTVAPTLSLSRGVIHVADSLRSITPKRRSNTIWTPAPRFKVPYKAIEAMRVGDYLELEAKLPPPGVECRLPQNVH